MQIGDRKFAESVAVHFTRGRAEMVITAITTATLAGSTADVSNMHANVLL